MKKLIIPLLISIAFPSSAIAQFNLSVHEICKDVTDYDGCVKANKDFDPQEIKKLNIFGFKYQPMVGRGFDGTIFVLGVIKDSSADKAGLKFGDQIIRVNDEFLSKVDPEQSMLQIREATKDKILKLKIARYSLKKNKKARNVEVLDIQMDKNELKITVSDLFRFNDRKIIQQKLNAFVMNNLYIVNPSEKKSKRVYTKRNNDLLDQVNRRNFHHMLKRNETTGIRTYQPNYQPYGDVYGTSGQYGAGGY